MKKMIAAIVAVLGVLLVAFGISVKVKEAAAVSMSGAIIGGADGPTAIFVAGKIGDGFVISLILVGIILTVAAVAAYRKISKK